MIEVHEGIRWPQGFLKFLAGNELAAAFQQHLQNLEGLARKAQANAVFAQFQGLQIRFKGTETANCRKALPTHWHIARPEQLPENITASLRAYPPCDGWAIVPRRNPIMSAD